MRDRRKETQSLNLFEELPNNKKAARRRGTRKARKGKLWVKVLGGLAAIVAIVAIVLFVYANSKLNKLDKVHIDNDKLSCVDVDGYVNILMLGTDTRNMEKVKGSRTDAIILISINEKTNDVKLTSIYRDTMLKMGGKNDYDKAAHAFAFGGPEMAIRMVNEAMDLNVEKFVVVNFKSVADMIDAAGGIELNIEEYEIEELNNCIEETARVTGKSDAKIHNVGKQKVNGVQAVSYGRMRNGVGDDFKRTERMRIVMTALADKLKKSKLSLVDKLLNKTLPQVKTNLSNSDIIALGARVHKYNVIGSSSFPTKLKGATIGGVSYLIPDNLEDNVVDFHRTTFKQKDYVPSSKVMKISAAIASKTQGVVEEIPKEVIINDVKEEIAKPEVKPELKQPENDPLPQPPQPSTPSNPGVPAPAPGGQTPAPPAPPAPSVPQVPPGNE